MKNRRKAVQPFEIKKRKIDISRNYEANGFEKNQRKFENFSTLISKKSSVALQQAPGLKGRLPDFIRVSTFTNPIEPVRYGFTVEVPAFLVSPTYDFHSHFSKSFTKS